ncbi:MAG: hypothetical protein ACFFC7_24700 [Candidatus Hermodarchaeota archaeon]
MQKILVLSSQGTNSKNDIEESESTRIIPFLTNELLRYRIEQKYDKLEFDGELLELLQRLDELNIED